MSIVRVVRNTVRSVPQPVRFGARKLFYGGGSSVCPMCGNSVRTWLTHGNRAEVLYRRKVVGGMRRDHDECPICRSADRVRLMMLYLRDVLHVGERPLKVMHVAPDFGLHLWLRGRSQIDYVPTDLDLWRYRHMTDVVQADLTDLPFEAETFDVVICSHVLEHVPDDRKAMSEIRRVLKSGGSALLMAPMATDGAGTDEDPGVEDPGERDRRFGQWDHVRLYAPDDFAARLAGVGFDVRVFTGFDDFPAEAERLSLNPAERLFVARR
jgi:SAM-dependent methyltransferase